MMKRYIIAALALTVLGGLPAKADTSKLTTADGWTKITTLPSASDIANNYYVFVDNDNDLMLGIGKGVHQDTKWYSLGVYYQTSVEPTSADMNGKTWIVETSGSGFSLRNLEYSAQPMMTEWNAAWKFDTNDIYVPDGNWTVTLWAYANGSWTIQNGKYTGGYLGPWDNVIENGAECAANKSGNDVGHFQIYAINRTQFQQNLLANASSSNPVDLTPWYVTNATFDGNNSDGWETSFTANSSNWWGSHAFSNLGAENYQQVGEVKQTLTLPNGKYKVALQGASNKVSENQAYVFATHNGTTQKTYFTQSTVSTTDGNKWNDMQYNLLLMMQDRSYGQVQTPEVTVTTGSLTIGYKNESGHSWDVFDNFKLYCTGVDLSAYQTQLADLVNECNTFISSNVVPDACEATISSAVTTYNQSYSTAKEYSNAIVALTAVLDTYRNDTELQAAYAAYKTMRTNVQGLENTTTYKYTDAGDAKSTFDGAISSANTAVEAATTSAAINTQTANIRAAAMTFVSSVTAEDGNPFNLTFLASTSASDWQTASGLNAAATAPAWSVPKPDDSMADFVESYTEAAGGESITGNILYQTLSGMPAGYYTVALYAAASYTPNRGSLVEKCTDGQPNITFGFAGESTLSLPVVHRTTLTAADQVPVNLSVQLASDGNLSFGIKKTAAGSNWHVAQIYTITYSKDPDLTVLKADRDALVSEANGLLASSDASLLTTEQRNALSSAISTANSANTFDALTTVTLTTLPNAIQTARQQIQQVKANRVGMIAALERFENDYNLADGTDYRRLTMSADAWATLINKVNAVTTALDDVSQASSYGTIKDELVAQMDDTDASIRLFKSYKAMVDGTTALSIVGDYGVDGNMDTDDTEQTAIAALNTAFVDYAANQTAAIDMSAFLGENLDFSAAAGSVINGENSNTIKNITGWVVDYADADTWTVVQTDQSDNAGKLYMRKNWGSAATTLKVFKEKMLPVGRYKLSFAWNSNMANMTNLSCYKLGDTSTTIGEATNGELEYEFTVTDQPTTFDLTFGFQKTGTGDSPAQIIVDDVQLIRANDVTLDENATELPDVSEYAIVTLGRAFNAGWNALCLPFDAPAFDGAEIAEFDGEEADGNDVTLLFKKVDSFKANVPYFVYFPAAVATGKKFAGVTLQPAEVMVEGTAFNFCGTYIKQDIAVGNYVISGGKLSKASTIINLKGTRTYFTPKSTSGARRIIGFTVESQEATGIANVFADGTPVALEGVYNLSGQKVKGQLKKGVYVVNGKKAVVK